MAIKYIIEGATFNGDGTSSAEAASAWGVWAWNHIDIIGWTATWFGSISPWDTIYIRSKTGNWVNANITYTPWAAKSYGLASATITSPITWILDNGTIWPGIDGTLTLTASTSAMTQTLRNYNNFISSTPENWIIENTGASLTFSQIVIGLCNTYWLWIKEPNVTNIWFSNGIGWTHENMRVTVWSMCQWYGIFFVTNSKVVFINPTFEVLWSLASVQPFLVFAGTHGRYEIRWGEMIGAGTNSGLVSLFLPSTFSSWNGSMNAIGFQVPKVVPIAQPWAFFAWSIISMAGMDGGSGWVLISDWWSADSRNLTNNYPTLNATLSDSVNTPSSWRLYPKTTWIFAPFEMPIAKLFTGTSSIKTLTLNFLATTWWAGTALNTSNLWLSVNYIDDATGETKYVSSKASTWASLTTSGLTWSPSNAWGAVSLTAYKMEITTPTAIKKDTAVNISFMGITLSANANDIFIIDPDIQIS